MGPCAGGAVYSPALTDFTFMVKVREKSLFLLPFENCVVTQPAIKIVPDLDLGYLHYHCSQHSNDKVLVERRFGHEICSLWDFCGGMCLCTSLVGDFTC